VVSSSPDGRVYEGGCDLPGGGRVEGRAIVRDDGPGDAFGAPGETFRIAFDRFSIERGGRRYELDGTVVQRGDVQTIELGAVIDGIYAESRLTHDITDGGHGGSGEVDVEGFGEIAVTGVWSPGREPSGILRLGASDELLVAFDGACSTYQIDRRDAGTYCIADAPVLDLQNELEVAYRCDDDTREVTVTAWTRYPYTAVDHYRIFGRVIVGDHHEYLKDTYVPLTSIPSTDGPRFEATFPVCPGFLSCTCADLDTQSHVVTAFVGDVEVAQRTSRPFP
jgi:hypothetical protein